MGKKSTREGPEQPRKEYIDTSLFYSEYLNNSLNYILSGSNDLDHTIQFDNSALKQIVSNSHSEESIHFVERVKLMKMKCDPNVYLKDIQQYGEFINYDLSKANQQEIMGIQNELQEEFDLSILVKRIRKKHKKLNEKISLYQIEQLQKQIKNSVLNRIVKDCENCEVDYDRHLEGNRLYREMFNIQETHIKQEKLDSKKTERCRQSKNLKRSKVNDDYIPSNAKYKEILTNSQKTGGSSNVVSNDRQATVSNEKMIPEDKIKKEEYIQKNPIRFYHTPQPIAPPESALPAPAPVPAPIKLPPLIMIPSTAVPPLVSTTPAPIIEAEVVKVDQPAKELPQTEKPVIKQNEINPSSNITPAEPVSRATDSEKKAKKEKKIDKEQKEKVKKPKPAKHKEDEEGKPKKRQYNRKQPPQPKSQTGKDPLPPVPLPIPIQMQVQIPPTIIIERKPATIGVEIGIQADGNEDLQNLKVIAPRQTQQQPFTFTAIAKISIAPTIQVEVQRQKQENSEMIPEPKEQLPQLLNANNPLNSSIDLTERFLSIPPPNSSLFASQRMDIEQPSPQVQSQIHEPLRKGSENIQKKKEEFNIDDYLI